MSEGLELLTDRKDLEAVKKFAFPLCAKFLGGVWNKTTIDEFKVTIMTGGLINYMYKCELTVENFEPVDDEPKVLILRINGETKDENQQTVDLVHSLVLSEQKVGPKVYGFFKGGRLEEFINAPTLQHGDWNDPDTSKLIARAFADFHLVKMPANKEPWIYKATEEMLAYYKTMKFDNENEQKIFETIKSYNFEQEFEQLKKVLDCADSPIVFVHYDTQMCNIMKTYPNLTMIDYDFAGYLPRGFEFGQFFTEMAFDNHTKTYPCFEYNHDRYPSREYQMDFFNTYIERLVQTGKKKGIKFHPALKDLDDVALEYETNVCLLMGAILNIMYCFVKYEELKAHNFGGIEYALTKSEFYFKMKNSLFPNGYEADVFGN